MKCLYHAVKLFLTRDGYLWIRQSKFYKWLPHFGWSKNVTDSEHWQPDNPVIGWVAVLHKLFAKGKVKKGD